MSQHTPTPRRYVRHCEACGKRASCAVDLDGLIVCLGCNFVATMNRADQAGKALHDLGFLSASGGAAGNSPETGIVSMSIDDAVRAALALAREEASYES